MRSKKPYLIRAMYEWIVDNELSPYLAVDATVPLTHVPKEHVKDGKIVLDVSPNAVNMLNIANDRIEFGASFNSQHFSIYIPIKALKAIYAAENGEGMVFEEQEGEDDDTPPPPTKKPGPHLKVVK